MNADQKVSHRVDYPFGCSGAWDEGDKTAVVGDFDRWRIHNCNRREHHTGKCQCKCGARAERAAVTPDERNEP